MGIIDDGVHGIEMLYISAVRTSTTHDSLIDFDPNWHLLCHPILYRVEQLFEDTL